MANFDDLLENNTPAEEEQSGQRLSSEEYAAKKKAEREAVYALSDSTAMEVAADGARFQKYLDVQSRFSRYSANNALLILAQKPDATRFGELKYWRSQKVFIKQSEMSNGFIILKQGDEYRRKDGGVGVSYDPVTVYDISQAERKILPPQTASYDERQLLQALISRAPMKIYGVDELPNNLCAMTDSQTGEIRVRKGLDFARTFSAVAQCMAAADISENSDTRLEPGFSDCCVSYILCKKYGVDTQIFRFDDAPDIFEGLNAQEIKGELSQIRDAADTISGRMAKQLDAVRKAAKNREEAR
jgi:hypothetical protein